MANVKCIHGLTILFIMACDVNYWEKHNICFIFHKLYSQKGTKHNICFIFQKLSSQKGTILLQAYMTGNQQSNLATSNLERQSMVFQMFALTSGYAYICML